jgi:chromosome segregation ATPase
LLILCLEELNYDELFPEITSSSRDALRRLEDMKLEREAELAQTKQQLENITDLLIQKPNQPTFMARLDAAQAAFDNLSAAVRTLESQIQDERERAKTAEQDFQQVQDGLQRLDRAHRTRGPELYDLRARLHQLLSRTIKEITLHGANGAVFAPEHSGNWTGAIAVRFESTNIARTLYVEKGLRACHSVPTRNGKADHKRAKTLRVA